MLRKWGFFILGLVLILGGSYLANAIQTSGGVALKDVRFAGDGGLDPVRPALRAGERTAAHPAPAVLASHGYINTREMQSPFAIELARRGFVVLAMDMVGHGYSEGAVGQARTSAARRRCATCRACLSSTRPISGSRATPWAACRCSAAAGPAGRLQGHRPRGLDARLPGRQGARQTIHNLAVVFGQFDEFAPLMWGVPKGSLVASSPKLAKVFGPPCPVLVGKIYGEIADGSARVLENPPVTHPWEHFSRAGVGGAVDWFQKTLVGEANPLPPGDQIWLWKDIGTAIGFMGFVVLLIGTFEGLLTLRCSPASTIPWSRWPSGAAGSGGWRRC